MYSASLFISLLMMSLAACEDSQPISFQKQQALPCKESKDSIVQGNLENTDRDKQEAGQHMNFDKHNQNERATAAQRQSTEVQWFLSLGMRIKMWLLTKAV